MRLPRSRVQRSLAFALTLRCLRFRRAVSPSSIVHFVLTRRFLRVRPMRRFVRSRSLFLRGAQRLLSTVSSWTLCWNTCCCLVTFCFRWRLPQWCAVGLIPVRRWRKAFG